MAQKTIEEIFNLAYDESSNSLTAEKATGGAQETDGTVQDILNKAFNEATNSIKIT